MAANPIIKIRVRIRQTEPDIQFDWLGDTHIAYIYNSYYRNRGESVNLEEDLPDVRSIAGTNGDRVSYALFNMTKLKNIHIKEAFYETVFTLHRLICGFRYSAYNNHSQSIPLYIGNVYMRYYNFLDPIILTPDVLRLGVKSGLIQILSISSELMPYYNRGWLPTITVRGDSRIYRKEGETFEIDTNVLQIENQINFINSGFVEQVIKYPNVPEHIKIAAGSYNETMTLDEIRELANSIGMLIPRRLTIENAKKYLFSNFQYYFDVDPAVRITDHISSRFNFKIYSDKAIFRALGLYFSYNSRPEIFAKIEKLFSKSRNDIVPVVITNKKFAAKFSILETDLIMMDPIEDFITSERGEGLDEKDTLYWFGNYSIKFLPLSAETFNDNIANSVGHYIHQEDWAYRNEDDSLDLRPYRIDTLKLVEDVKGFKGINTEEFLAKKKAFIRDILEKLKYGAISEELKILVAGFSEEARNKIKDDLIAVFNAGMYGRQWYGPGSAYPLAYDASRNEDNAYTWPQRILQRRDDLPQDIVRRVEEAVANTRQGDITLLVFVGDMLSYTINKVNTAEYTREEREIYPNQTEYTEDERKIFQQKLYKGSSLPYSHIEENATLLEFMQLVANRQSQYGGCLRAASKKLIYNAVFLLKGLFEVEIPGFNYAELESIT
jgi:hypothetical protein